MTIKGVIALTECSQCGGTGKNTVPRQHLVIKRNDDNCLLCNGSGEQSCRLSLKDLAKELRELLWNEAIE